MSNAPNIELNELYVLESTKTHEPYVSPDGISYVFLREDQARAMSETTPDTQVPPPKYYSISGLSMLCYAAGADQLMLAVGTETSTVELNERNLPIGAYNHLLKSVLSQIIQTEKPKYLDYLAECSFIIPAKTVNGKTVEIFYAVARHKVEEYGTLYVAFSSLDEYKAWAIGVQGWSPLYVSWQNLWRIAKRTGFILNPNGNQLVVTKKLMRDIEKKRAEREEEAREEAAAMASTKELEKGDKKTDET